MNNPIKMKSEKYEVIKIKKRTQAKVFKNVEPGDIVQFSIGIERAGSNSGTYASYITFENLTKKETARKSFNEMPKLIENFELAEM